MTTVKVAGSHRHYLITFECLWFCYWVRWRTVPREVHFSIEILIGFCIFQKKFSRAFKAQISIEKNSSTPRCFTNYFNWHFQQKKLFNWPHINFPEFFHSFFQHWVIIQKKVIKLPPLVYPYSFSIMTVGITNCQFTASLMDDERFSITKQFVLVEACNVCNVYVSRYTTAVVMVGSLMGIICWFAQQTYHLHVLFI